MADQLTITNQTTGLATVVAVRLNADLQWWNTSGSPAFETYNAANIASYGIAMSEVGATGVYTVDDPAPTVEGSFIVAIRAGASLAVSDLLTAVGQGVAGPVNADMTQIGGDAQSATDLKDFADAGYDPATNKVQGVVLVDTTTTNTDMRGTDSALTSLGTNAPAGWINEAAFSNDAITDAKVAADVTIASVTGNVGGNVVGSVGSVTGAVASVTNPVTVGTNNDKTGYSLTATTGLGNQTADITGSLSGSVGSVTGAVGSVAGAVTVGTNNDKSGYALTPTTGLGNQTADITGNLSGSVGSVSGNVGGNVVGSVASVTGAVGSVTGNVGGNVVGSVASVTGAVGSVTGNVGGNVVGSVGSVLGGINTTAGTITTLDALDTAQDTQHSTTQNKVEESKVLTESQRGTHTIQGNIYYVDPVNGDTHANGNRGGKSDPYSSIQDCHDNAVTDSNHDLIWLVSGASGGATTLTENVTISKRYTQVRGPGRDFIVQAASNTDTITLTADGVELSGFQVRTTGVGVGKGIQATTADYVGLRRIWLTNTRGDGINLTNCTNAVVQECNLQGCGQSGAGNGIKVAAGTAQNSSYCRILSNYVENTAGSGIVLDTTGSGTITSCVIVGNRVFHSTTAGIEIVDSGTTDTVITDNRLAGNALDFSNNSTAFTYYNNEPIYDTVWLDTVNGDDGDPGTAAQPVATVARAKVIAADLSKRITVVPGSSFTLASAFDSYSFFGSGYTVALGGQSISAARFENAAISGTGTGASRPTFFKCSIGTATLPPSIFEQCNFTATMTAGSAGNWTIDFCESGVPGASSPTFNLNSTGSNNVNITNWARGLTLSGLASGDVATPNGVFNTLTLNGADATVNVSGQYGTLTNNLTGTPTVLTTNAFQAGDVSSILEDTGTTLPASIATVDTVVDGIKAVTDLLLTATGTIDNSLADATTTVFKTDLVAVNDFYNDQQLLITSGSLAGQVKPISDFAQTNGVITLAEGLTTAPANGVTFAVLAFHVHSVSQIQSGLATDTALQTVDDEVGAIATSINSGSVVVASVTGAVGSVTDPVTAGTVNDKTGYSLDTNQMFNNTGTFTGDINGSVTGSVDSVTSGVTLAASQPLYTPAVAGDAMALTSGERTTLAGAILDLSNGVETSITLRQAQRLILAAATGKLAGAATTTITIRDTADSKDRITATVDSDGNRTAVTLDAT